MALKKICTRCNKIIEIGQTCPCTAAALKESRKQYDTVHRDKDAKRFYGSKAWTSKRDRILKMDGCDVYLFITRGIVVPADTVHHVEPLAERWDLKLATDNLMSLSHDTHSMIERWYKQKEMEIKKELKEILTEFRRK